MYAQDPELAAVLGSARWLGNLCEQKSFECSDSAKRRALIWAREGDSVPFGAAIAPNLFTTQMAESDRSVSQLEETA